MTASCSTREIIHSIQYGRHRDCRLAITPMAMNGGLIVDHMTLRMPAASITQQAVGEPWGLSGFLIGSMALESISGVFHE